MAEMSGVPMVASWLMLVLVLVFAIGVGCVLSARTRIVGLVLLALLAFGFFSVRVQVHRSTLPAPAARIEPIDQHAPTIVHVDKNFVIESNLHVAQQHAKQAEAQAQAAASRAQAEIVRNQRLTAQVGATVVQHAPNGDILETYPDGMQVKQNFAGFREIVRESDGEPALESAATFRSDLSLYVLGAPLLVLAVAFIALRSRSRVGGSGLVLAAILVGIVLFGYLFTGVRNVHVPDPIEVSLDSPRPTTLPVHGPVAGEPVTFGEHGEMVEQAPGPVPSADSIEKAWARLTDPKIKLEPSEATKAKISRNELAAAKTVLTTTAPGIDPITQSWLASVAKATLHALAQGGQASEEHSMQTSVEAVEEAITQVAEADKAGAAKTAEEPRPTWLDDTPETLVGNSGRMVVSSDPFVSAAEAREALRQELRAVVHARLVDVVAAANGGQEAYVPSPEQLGISDEFIESELLVGKYLEPMNLSVGEMKRAHALVEFAETKDPLMLERWIGFAQRQSIENIGRLSLFAVGGLGLVFGLLKVDTWTRGYYTKRLFIGVPAAIIAFMLLTLA